MSTLRSITPALLLAALLLTPAAWSQQVAPFELTTRVQELDLTPASESAGSPMPGGDPSSFDEPALGMGPRLAVVGDLDGNGVPDLAWGGLTLLLMGEVGQVVETRSYWPGHKGIPVSANNTGFGASVTALGDINGDGLPDLAVGAPQGDGPVSGTEESGHVWILMTRPGEPQLTAHRIDADNPAFNGQVPSFGRLGTSLAGLGDIDGDGLVEVVAGAPGTGHLTGNPDPHGALWLLSINENGAQEGPAQRIAPPDLTAQWPLAAGFGARIAAPGDLDGDGHLDLVVTAENQWKWILDPPSNWHAIQGAVSLLRLEATGDWSEIGRLEPDDPLFQAVAPGMDSFGQVLIAPAGDLDADGTPDLVFGDWLLRSPGDPEASVLTPLPPLREAVPWIDLDSDGLEEWIGWLEPSGLAVMWHRMPGRWVQPTLVAQEQQVLWSGTQPTDQWALTAADDRDHDGASDLHTRYHHVPVQPGGSAGSEAPLASTPEISFTIGDVDGDGRLDTAHLDQSWDFWINPFGQPGYLVDRRLDIERTQAGPITAWESLQEFATALHSNPAWVASAGDLDGNGVPDLLMRSVLGEAQLLWLDGQGQALDVMELIPSFPLGSALPVPLGDVDGDGGVDLLCSPPADDPLWGHGSDPGSRVWILHLDPHTAEIVAETDITHELLKAASGLDRPSRSWTAVPTPWGVRIACPQRYEDRVLVADLDHEWQAIGSSVVERSAACVAATGWDSRFGVAWIDEPGDAPPRLAVGLRRVPQTVDYMHTIWQTDLAHHPVRQVPMGQPGPMLSLHGGFAPLEPCAFRVYGAPAHQPALLVAGLEHVGLPLHGGVLVPSPDVLIAGFETTAGGRLAHSWPWPDDVPSGLEVFWQVWVRDPDSPQGWLATQGAASITP